MFVFLFLSLSFLSLFLSLQGVDVIINASSMDDIDPSAIGQRLTNGTGPSASPVLGRLRMRDEENAEHVVRDAGSERTLCVCVCVCTVYVCVCALVYL